MPLGINLVPRRGQTAFMEGVPAGPHNIAA